MVGFKRLALLIGALLPINAAPVEQRAPQAVANSYIITLKPGASVDSHISWVSTVHSRSVAKRETTGVNKVYEINDFKGYSGSFDAATLAEIKASDAVATVEPNQVWTIEAITTQEDAPWGLGSISHREAGSTEYVYDDSAGEGTFAYTIDTGVYPEHEEFEGRVSLGYNAYPGSNDDDNQGHGTHVLGTILSRAYGVSKKATGIAVKVFDTGSSTTEIVLDGYVWAVNDIQTNGREAVSVVSLSLGGPFSDAFNTAVNNAFAAGVSTVVAAGNEGQDAGGRSPASAADAITVGAVDSTDARASWSNYGPVVDVFAPGVDVLSAWTGGPDATDVISGTSMATPHVSGLVLYLKALEGLTSSADVTARILALATEGVVLGPGTGSPNLLAFNGATA